MDAPVNYESSPNKQAFDDSVMRRLPDDKRTILPPNYLPPEDIILKYDDAQSSNNPLQEWSPLEKALLMVDFSLVGVGLYFIFS